MSPSAIVCAAASALLLVACQPEPERSCNRVRFGWPNFEVDSSSDTDANTEGLQIDFSVNSDLFEGVRANLSLAIGEEDPVLLGTATSEAGGQLNFSGITVPLGDIVFFVEARDECGRHRSGKRLFVWDGLGIPKCSLELGSGPGNDPESLFPVLYSEHDEDPASAGMQVLVTVDAGRPDMEIRLFVVDRETGATQDFVLTPSEDGTVSQELTLAEGEQALRAVCLWEPKDLRPSTPTYTFQVDSLK